MQLVLLTETAPRRTALYRFIMRRMIIAILLLIACSHVTRSSGYEPIPVNNIGRLQTNPLLIDVIGKIIDEAGKPVIANITIKGTRLSATSNDDGEFRLDNVSKNAVLIISAVNIEALEVKVNGAINLGTITVKTKVRKERRYWSIPAIKSFILTRPPVHSIR